MKKEVKALRENIIGKEIAVLTQGKKAEVISAAPSDLRMDVNVMLDETKYTFRFPSEYDTFFRFTDKETHKAALSLKNKIKDMVLQGNQKEALESVITSRNITELVHYTSISNLLSILETGSILPRAKHSTEGIKAQYVQDLVNDYHTRTITNAVKNEKKYAPLNQKDTGEEEKARLKKEMAQEIKNELKKNVPESFPCYSSFAVSYLGIKDFRKFVMELVDKLDKKDDREDFGNMKGFSFAVITLDPAFLADAAINDIHFCKGKAESGKLPANSAADFENLFLGEHRNGRLPNSFPSTAKSEILVGSPIPVKYIKSIEFKNQKAAQELKDKITDPAFTELITVNTRFYEDALDELWK